MDLENFLCGLEKRNPNEPEFLQAAGEIAEALIPWLNKNPKYIEARVLERLTEPDRTVSFRVSWEDDEGNVRINKGYRVQFSNAIGPYKGGLRFHPTVNQSVLKFLGFEQIFKNSLTGLPMGAGKGGSDFNPKGKSDREVMRFCQAYMTELEKYIGKDRDIPAGDIGVGAREIGFMFGQHKRLSNQFTGVLTGKGLAFGGSLIRTEATGYGCVYFLKNMLEHQGVELKGKRVAISGSGNVALYASEKCIHEGALVVSVSDSAGTLYIPDGLTTEQLAEIQELKGVKRERLSELSDRDEFEYLDSKRPWGIKCDYALPCATQNEIEKEDALNLINNGCKAVCEGANMPSSPDAIHLFKAKGVLFAPGKASNAGGVAVSGLEMAQNSIRMSWSREELDDKLQGIMKEIHSRCIENGTEGENVDYVKGAVISGFQKVADAILSYGVI
jgi:glutamate dehydrogenase (NADP+)